jgi:hypothetical protein
VALASHSHLILRQRKGPRCATRGPDYGFFPLYPRHVVGLAKIEKERGVTDADDFFNQTLRRLGEPPRASTSEAFIAVLKLMQTPDWIERLRAAGFDNPPTPAADKDQA